LGLGLRLVLLSLLLLQLLLLARRLNVGQGLRGFDAGDDRSGVDLAGGGVDDGDAVAIERAGEGLFERGTIGSVASARSNQLSIGRGNAFLLHQDVGSGRGSQMEFLDFGVEALLVVVVVGDGGGNSGAVVGERVLLADDVHPNLNVELLQGHLRFAVFNLRARLIGLRGTVAQRDVHRELDALVRTAAVPEIFQHGAVASIAQEGAVRWGKTKRREGLWAVRADRAAEGAGAVKGLQVKDRQQTVLHSLEGDLVDFQVQGRLFHVGAIGLGFAHQIVHGHVLLGYYSEADAIGGNDGGVGKGRIVEVAGDGLLHDELLILEGILRGDERLLIAGHLAFGVDDIERRHAADLELFLVVSLEARGLIESALFGLHVLIGADEAPIDVLHLVDGVEELLAEDGVGDTAVVLRLDNEAAVDAGAKALQKMLGEGEVEGGLQLRAEKTKKTVGGGTRIVEDHLHVCARDEPLIEAEIVSIDVLCNRRQASGKDGAGLRLNLVIELDGPGEGGVEILRGGAGAVGGKGQTAGSSARDAGARATTARTASNGADGCRGAALGAGNETAADAADPGRARFGVQQVDVGDVKIEALDGDVVVILERKEHGVAEAEIDFAVLHEAIELRRIEKIRRRHCDRRIGSEGILPIAALFRVVMRSIAHEEGLGRIGWRSRGETRGRRGRLWSLGP